MCACDLGGAGDSCWSWLLSSDIFNEADSEISPLPVFISAKVWLASWWQRKQPILFDLSATSMSNLPHSDGVCHSLFLLRYLVKNSATLFSASDYEVAPPEYHRKAVWELWATSHHHPVRLQEHTKKHYYTLECRLRWTFIIWTDGFYPERIQGAYHS